MSDPTGNLDGLSEPALIAHVFAPLTLECAGSFDLKDDAAFVSAGTSGLIITADQVIEGTHFLATDPTDMVARRLVRRNLSDLIAKATLPTAAFLSLAWPKSRPRSQLALFAEGLGDDLKFLCGQTPLMGGDTSVTDGPLVASLTMMGTPMRAPNQFLLRSGAKAGDMIVVTGTIGDAWLGLQVRLGLLDQTGLEGCTAFAMAPQPPKLAIAGPISVNANASLDVSDGLIADAGHMAAQSGVAIEIDLARLPVSREALDWIDRQRDRLGAFMKLATGGDDYQPLMAIPPEKLEAFEQAAAALGVQTTHIGQCHVGEGLRLWFEGNPVALPSRAGWSI